MKRLTIFAAPVAATIAIVGTALTATSGPLSPDVFLPAGFIIIFTTVGTLIEARRPGQVVGRICLGFVWLIVVSALMIAGAAILDSRPGRIPALGAALAVVGSAGASLTILLSGPLLISRFPDGRDAGRLASLVDGLLVLAVAMAVAGIFRPGPIELGNIEHVDNPLGIRGVPLVGTDELASLILVTYAVLMSLSTIGLLRRYRRGSTVVRAQIRWFGASVGLSFGLLVLVFASSGNDGFNNVAWGSWIVSLILPPIAIGIAILRYRLYDIDRIVSNAIGYGLVTVALFGIFFAVNVTLVSNVSSLAGNSGIVVAATTLLVAALFNSLRIRVQRRVDRRFHRARYDADRMVAEFSGRLRDEVEITRLRQDILDVVDRSVAPDGVGLWLRPGPAR